MTSPYESGAVTEFPLSGNNTLDAFVNWGFKWGAGGVGVGATVTYSFPQAGAEWIGDYYDGEPFDGFQAFNASQQQAARDALSLWQEVANITFVEVDETPTNGPVEGDVGDIRFGFSAVVTNDPYAAAWAYFPFSDPNYEFPEAGDVWFDPAYGPNLQMQPGQFGFSTLIHEIGHAIGLDHPFNDGDGEPVLPASMDNNQYTIMAYDLHPTASVEAMSPMLLDILAIQYLYGANTNTRSGNDTYKFSSGTEELRAIWDAGGIDTFDCSNQTLAVKIDLNDGAFSSIGRRNIGGAATNNIAIAYNAMIENAIGGSGNDQITGNELANVIDGGAGNDRMYGGSGNDTYYVNSASDVIDEQGNSDVADEIRTTVSINMAVLGAGLIENARAWTTAAINITGNAKNNYILGSVAKNTLDGGAADDILWGNDGDDLIIGGTGNDYLDGGAGNDALRGGKGNDVYLIDSLSDVIDEQGNTDTGDDVRGYFSFDLNTLGGGAIDRAILFGSADLFAIGNARANRLAGNSGANLLDGGGGDDLLLGGDGDDTLIGGAGHDWLSGAGGNDMFKGGTGNDIYVVDSPDEIVDEESNKDAGDQIRAPFTVDLETYAGGQIEIAVISGGDALDAYGNAAANLLWGNDAANTLDGRGGDDTLIGNGGDDALIGGQGNDWIDGGLGNDEMKGGSGNDRYIVDSADDVIDEEGNTDSADEVRATVSVDISVLGGGAVENIVLQGSGAIDATGNAGANKIYGNAGNNVLDGGLADDILLGGAGNDTYVVDGLADVIDEQGNKDAGDEIRTGAFSIVLSTIAAGALENATLLGGDDLDITGTSANNRLIGNSGVNTLIGANGNDYLDGGAGDDVMKGGAGNDIYVVDTLADIIDEGGSGDSADEIRSSNLSIDLNDYAGAGLENATLTGSVDLDIVGDNGANILIGNSGANKIAGGAGADKMDGGAGADILVSLGVDTLIGGAGNDTFVLQDLDFASILGGADTDTVMVSGANIALDLRNTSSLSVAEIEIIDLTGTGDNAAFFSADSFSKLTPSNDTIRVMGDSGDAVWLDAAFTSAGSEIVDGRTYDLYTSGTSKLAIENTITLHTLPPSIPPGFADLDGSNGFAVTVPFSGKLQVAGLGDINGDGYADIITGVGSANPDGVWSEEGAAYIVYGTADGFGATIDPLAPGVGFTILGEGDRGSVGQSASAAGDFNGDGIEDILVGAPWAYHASGRSNGGCAYVIYGNSAGLPASLDLDALSPATGLRIVGANANHTAAYSVSSIGDLNGDGLDDILLTAKGEEANGSMSGTMYVVFGRQNGLSTDLDLNGLSSGDGFKMIAPANSDVNSYATFRVGMGGDFNGDGFDDLMIGAGGADPNGTDSGAAYIVFGHAGTFTSNLSLSNLNGTNGFRLSGAAATNYAGFSLSSAGDVNGDGFDDIIVGAIRSSQGASLGGSAYVVFGHSGAFASTLNLGSLNGSNGFRIDGLSQDRLGASVSGGGDVNGDGYDDIIIGSPTANGNQGAVTVIYGHAGAFSASEFVSSIQPDEGFTLVGSKYGTGSSVSMANDINGDGFDDFVTGASGLGGSGKTLFATFGSDFTGSVTHFGTSDADVITATAGADVIVAGQGNDVINASGGSDAVQGGSGDDEIHVADNKFFRIDGGTGIDTLHLDYAGAIDFSNLDGKAGTSDRNKISGIETIDVDNSVANTVSLRLADLLDLDVDSSNVGGVGQLDNALKIDGNSGDTLTLFASDQWSAADTATLLGYAVYTHGAIRIAIDNDIAVAVT